MFAITKREKGCLEINYTAAMQGEAFVLG